MSSQSNLISVEGRAPSDLVSPSTGVVIWVGLTDESSDVLTKPDASDRFAWGLIQAIQNSHQDVATTAVIVWPRKKLSQSANDYAFLVRDISVGVIQSAQYDLGSRGIRVNLILCFEDQIKDINRTLKYFHGENGGFVAGCTFDLRENQEVAIA